MNFLKQPRSRRNSYAAVPFHETEKWKSINISSGIPDDSSEGSDDDEPKTKDLINWEDEMFGRDSIDQVKSEEDIEVNLTKKQTFVLSTLISNELLLMQNFDDKPKRFVGVLLMADVSGYTALSEKYANTGKGGPYRLTVTLNSYLGALIDLIYRHGGDVQKFAGDAFLALWKLDKKTFLSHVIHDVIVCALVIQHSYGNYETDVKVNLKVKLAISAGNIYSATIGSGLNMNYIICGLPVLEAKYAESVCDSGEVKLAATAWAHCYSRNYDHIINKDGTVTIRSILYDPREKDVSKPFSGFGQLIKQIRKPFNYDLNEILLENPDQLNLSDTMKRNDALSLRSCILKAEQSQIGSEIRRFMIRPVLTQIDAHQPLEYLTEMRNVSILFITLKPKPCPFPQLITIVDNAYKITCDVTYKSMGCVNKIILFDKDVMILVVFGLRGFKHTSEAQAALKSAYMIRKLISTLDGVVEVSIGVTTGQVYCGVVGHPLRREFTVIGSVVNKAARLMCYYRERVACDEETFVKSKMSKNGFTLQEHKVLKGMANSGKIYEYSEDIRTNTMYDITLISPLLNRKDEMEYFTNWLDRKHSSYKDFNALLLIGEPRIGKSRLLEWMHRYAKNKKHQTSYIILSTIHSATPYLGLTQIFDQILQISPQCSGFEKEEKIVELLKVYIDDLCYLNNIIKVRFAFYEGMNTVNETYRLKKAKTMFEKILNAIQEKHVVFWDDLQNLDSFSWEFASIMIRSKQIFSVFTVTRGKFPSTQQWLYNVFIDQQIRKVLLDALPSKYIAPLACQMLNVDAVPNELSNLLLTKSTGIPGHIETAVLHLFSSGAIEIVKVPKNELTNYENNEYVFPDTKLIKPLALNDSDQANLEKMIENDKSDEVSVCVIQDRDEIFRTNIHAQNTDALVMMQIDSLTPYQQLLLKIASVIGTIFARDLLECIMYENNKITSAKAIKRLFSMKILTCANKKRRFGRKQAKGNSVSLSEILSCDCPFEFDQEENYNLPKYAFCKFLKFKNKNTKNTCYELLPLNQKKEFHSRIVYYLENNNSKCVECGGMILVISPDSYLYRRRSTRPLRLKSGSTCYESENDFYDKSDLATIDRRNTNSGSIDSAINVMRSSTIDQNNFNKPRRTTNNYVRLKSTNSEPFANKRSVIIGPLKINDQVSEEELEPNNEFSNIRDITEAKCIEDWKNVGIYDSGDEEANNKEIYLDLTLEKGVSTINFSKCNCTDILLTTYEQLINHAGLAEMKLKVIEFLLKFSEINITVNHFDNAIDKTEEVERICDNPDALTYLDKITKKRLLARMYSIKAKAHLMAGRINLAKADLERALKIYRIDYQARTKLIKLRHIVNNIRQSSHKYRKNKLLMMTESVYCLNTATTLFSTIGELRIAKITSQIALDIIQKHDCDFANFSDALSNAMELELLRGYPDNTLQIEKITYSTLQRLSRAIQAGELCVLGKLFCAIYHARLARGDISSAIRSGFKAYTLSRFLYADQIALDIIPDLFYLLLARRRISEAVNIVQDLSRLRHINSKTWYYALCIDIILDAGVQIEAPADIHSYAVTQLGIILSSNQARRRLITGMWTYWLRADDEKNAKMFEEEAINSLNEKHDNGSLTWLLNCMRAADGMLESLARKVDDLKKVVDLLNLKSLAEKELTRLEIDSRCCKSVLPRWYYLKSCSYRLSGRAASANSSLNQALEESRKYKNRLEEAIITAGISNCSNIWYESAQQGEFIDWRAGIEVINESWPDLMFKIKLQCTRSNKIPENPHTSSFTSRNRNTN